jgi:hypothetical protein
MARWADSFNVALRIAQVADLRTNLHHRGRRVRRGIPPELITRAFHLLRMRVGTVIILATVGRATEGGAVATRFRRCQRQFDVLLNVFVAPTSVGLLRVGALAYLVRAIGAVALDVDPAARGRVKGRAAK